MVPFQSIIFMCITLGFVILASIILPIIIKKKWQTAVYPYFLGWAIFLIFALILESGMHLLMLRSTGDTITGNKWLYALYGGFAAGIFEETGRFLAMKLFMKKLHDAPHNALMYGAGHGGFEALSILGSAMLNNLIWSVLINLGQMDKLTNGLSGDILAQVEDAISKLMTTPSYQFLLGGVERVFAVILHIALSVLVWFAVKKRKFWLYPLAIFIHFFVDAATVVLAGYDVPVVLVECVVGALTVAAALIAKLVWRKNASPIGQECEN